MYNITKKDEITKEIKKYLYAVSEAESPEIVRVGIDGYYDSETAQAIQLFQKSRGLEVTGTVNYATFNALYAEYHALELLEEMSDSILEANFPLSRGDYGEDVRALHLLINQLRKTYREISDVGTGSYYSSKTEKAIKALRKVFMMPESADTDKILYDRMKTELNAQKRNTLTNDLKGS